MRGDFLLVSWRDRSGSGFCHEMTRFWLTSPAQWLLEFDTIRRTEEACIDSARVDIRRNKKQKSYEDATGIPRPFFESFKRPYSYHFLHLCQNVLF